MNPSNNLNARRTRPIILLFIALLGGFALSTPPRPADWFPLDVRFMAVVVAPGAVFAGWDRYLP